MRRIEKPRSDQDAEHVVDDDGSDEERQRRPAPPAVEEQRREAEPGRGADPARRRRQVEADEDDRQEAEDEFVGVEEHANRQRGAEARASTSPAAIAAIRPSTATR